MSYNLKNSGTLTLYITSIILAILTVSLLFHRTFVSAATYANSGSQIVTAFVPGPPPSSQAIILSPRNNQTVTTTPLVVSGTCGGSNNTVRVFLNGSIAGETACQLDGTFSLNIILNFGRNDLSAFVYDSLDQVGPNSDIITINVVPQTAMANEVATGGQNNISDNNSATNEPSYKADTGTFMKNPFRSIANVLGMNSTSATSPAAVKAATVVAGAGAIIVSIATAQFVLFWLINIDPTKTWAYRFLARIILK